LAWRVLVSQQPEVQPLAWQQADPAQLAWAPVLSQPEHMLREPESALPDLRRRGLAALEVPGA
jgi:hypothetical protein